MIYKEIKIYNKNKIKLIVIKTNYKSRIKHYKEFRESWCKKENYIQNKYKRKNKN